MKYAKLTLLFIVCAFTLTACDTVYKPPVTPICLKPEYTQSVICEIGTYLKFQPEQMNDVIIDATLFGIGTKIVDGPALRKSTAKVRKWVVGKDILTMEGVVKYVMTEADINPAFALLLKRRLPDFGGVPGLSIKPLQPIDKSMIIWELDQLDEYLSWF